ncbi:HAD-IA family hydrolase [Rhodothermus profundi]|uniref:Putative hydrolase of the HAD superfamily n=1 Tax=Rhodothermus profundi TaxID=633813 RepID=A0A1M6VS08_9BACT|nr:HAD-IA family hydrolase [Rhodothermus profundi]SHK84006.1 putative hydrolase of the HAD superfamily [Rhodothermus profundi]
MLSSKNPFENIRFIYFDLDDTLLDHRAAEQAALADVKAAFPDVFAHVPLEKLLHTYHTINTELWKQYQQGTIDRPALMHARFARLIDALALRNVTPDQLNACYMDRYRQHWRWTPGARDAFLTIAKHFPVGILTNGFAAVQHAKLARFPELRQHTRALVISEEVGVAKPHPALFAQAARAAATEPAAILYVGDSFGSDVVGAQNAGWQVAWYTPTPPASVPEGVFTFRCWPALLRQLGL